MTEAQFLYGDKEVNGKEAYLPTPLRPRSASKSLRSKMLDNGEAPPPPPNIAVNADSIVESQTMTESGADGATIPPNESLTTNGLSTTVGSETVSDKPLMEEGAPSEKAETAFAVQESGPLSLKDAEAQQSETETAEMLSNIIFPSSESANEIEQKTEVEEKSGLNDVQEAETIEELTGDGDEPKLDKGKGPEKPKVEIYTLPIGGGPKKNIVLPPIRTIPATRPRPVQASASSSRSRHTSSASRSTRSSIGIPRSIKRGVSLQHIASVPRRSVSKLSVVAQGAAGGLNATTSSSAPEQANKAGVTANGLVKRKPKPRRPKNTSQQYVYTRRKEAVNGQSQRRRVQRKPGQARRVKTSRPNAATAKAGDGELSSSAQGIGSSKPVMVAGQALEVDDREDDADGEDEVDAEGEDDDVSFMTAQDNDEALDDFDMEIAPMKYYEDEEENDGDRPPLGSYATHPPSKARLLKASELTLYDEDGNVVRFGSIFETRRTLICFLRHWLCPFCQMFARSIQAIDPLPLERANMNLVVVGQGHWHVTKSYKEVMKIPQFVRMYADPSRKIYKMLGMTLRTNDQGPACLRPDYQTMGVFKASMVAMKKGIFDMPLRVPGDLMLLGGEFIMGPGPQCSFTHRMLTTRGHLDLPKVLTEAGCDMSLKSAPGILEEQNKRPGSTRSTDRRFSRKTIANRLSRKGRSSADFRHRKSSTAATPPVMVPDVKSAFSEDEEAPKVRKTSSTYTKRKPAPLSDMRNIRIGYPVKQSQSGLSPSYDEFDVEDGISPINKDVVERGDSDIDNTLPSPYSPSHAANPLTVVEESHNLIAGIPKPSSSTDHGESTTRPSGSIDRPPVPRTSSAAAFAAATARAKAIQRQEQEKILAALGKDGQKGGLYSTALATESMPTLLDQKMSSPLMRALPSPTVQRKHMSNATGSTEGSATADSAYTAKTARSEDEELASPTSNGHTLIGSPDRNGFNTEDTTVEADLQQIGATNPLTRSGSAKRRGFVGTAGVPISVFEKLANAGSPKKALFSSSSPSLPLGDAAFSDAPSTGLQTPTTPRTEDGFGEDTEYRRLEKQNVQKPNVAATTSTDTVQKQQANGRGGAGLVPKPSKEQLNKPLPPLIVSPEEEDVATMRMRTAASEEEEDSQKTPRARKVSLGPDNKSNIPAQSASHVNGSPSQEIASSASYTKNRGSIIAASPTTPRFETAKVDPASATSSSFYNPLLAALPPMPAPLMPPPPPPSVPAVSPISARAPMPTGNPLFASIIAEEAARKNNVPTSGTKKSEPVSALSEWKQFKQAPSSAAQLSSKTSPVAPTMKKATGMTFGSTSFLDDLDVHDSLTTSKPSPNPAYSPNGGASETLGSEYANDDDEEGEEEEEDDWAPLHAGKNVVPAGIIDQDGEPTDTSASDLSTGEEDYDVEEDDEQAMSSAVQRYRGFMPAPTAKSPKKYTLKQVTSRASTSPSTSRPRKVDLKNTPRRLYSSGSRTGLSSFVEEEEEAASPPPQTAAELPIRI